MVKKVNITKIKSNPNNPRIIKDDKFRKLVKSIQEFPDMLKVRPIVVNKDMIVLGGNMRLKAIKEAGFKEVEVEIVNWDEQKQKEFIIKDNVGFGEWDWDDLANNWDDDNLDNWGLDIPKFDSNINLDEFFEATQTDTNDGKKKIILEYTDEDYIKVKDELLKYGQTPEAAIFNLLGL